MSKASGSIDLKSLKVAGSQATGYITEINNGGISVHESGNNQNLNYVTIDATGMEIFKTDGANSPSAVSVAKFGETTIIGKGANSGESYLQLDYHSLCMFDRNNVKYLEAVDLRDRTGEATITDTFTGDGETKMFFLSVSPAANTTYSVKVNGTEVSSSSISKNDSNIYFGTAPADGDTIVIVYTVITSNAKAYTFGSRNTNYSLGGLSFREGNYTSATAFAAHAEGTNTRASGNYSHAEGDSTITSGTASHAEGANTKASGHYSHAEGGSTSAKGESSHAEGYNTKANGDHSHAEGSTTYAIGNNSHAEGSGGTRADNPCDHAEGYYTVAEGGSSHSEGSHTRAQGENSHAEGYLSTARGKASHAEGLGTEANGESSHAEGEGTITNGQSSHTNGKRTVAATDCQTVIGRYNSATRTYNSSTGTYVYSNTGNYPFVIGNGEGDATIDRSNALTIDWDGNIVSQGMAGQIIMYAGSTAPTGWLLCNGQAVSRTTYATLFTIIGTTYGPGDGSTTFNVPDFRDRVGVGVGTTYNLNDTGGESTHTLDTTEIPAHTHGSKTLTGQARIQAESALNTVNMINSVSGIVGRSTSSSGYYTISGRTSINNQYDILTVTATHEHTSVGGSGAHNNMQPYIGINYIICTGKTS